MPVIDFHTHVFPDDVAARALGGMIDRTHLQAYYDGTYSGLLAEMDRAAIDISVLAPVATKASQVTGINDWTATLAGNRFIAFGAIHPDFPDPAAEIERIAAMGFRGVKLHPEFQSFVPEGPRMEPIYRACAEHAMPMLFHAGEDPNYDTVAGAPAAFRRVAERHPDVTLVLAHFGGYRCWDEVAVELIGSPVYLDTTHATELLAPETLLELMRAHGTDRVVFGSDGPWTDAAGALDTVRGLGLTDDELEAVLWGNAARLFGVERAT
ncbi:MAG: amidohydrolase family protein [Coriobacteriia bacterium]